MIFKLLLIAVLALAEFSQTGKASFYDTPKNHMASGLYFDGSRMEAAHKTLRFGTLVEVTNLRNGKTVRVVITDRGPYVKGRIIDLTPAAAQALDMIDAGVVPVTVTVIEPGICTSWGSCKKAGLEKKVRGK